MATRTETVLLDDLDGGPAVETIQFAVDGTDYEIDLSEKNAVKFRGAFKSYVQHARKTSRRRVPTSTKPPKRDAAQTRAIRDWARDQGWEISDRGRIPAEIEQAFQDAH